MQSEILFIIVLATPWVLLLAALYFYRHRRIRRPMNDSGDDRDSSTGGV